MKTIAFIPARSGSKRIPNKNIAPFAGHPLLAYTIRSAIESKIFTDVICATDNQEYAEIASHYGASVPFLRPSEISGDKSPDIEWVLWMLNKLSENGKNYAVFSILRPTNPFRLPETIKRAWNQFMRESDKVDSLRAVEKCKQHPGKMWILRNNRMHPLIPFSNGDTPWHSSQYPALPEIFVQNASLEIAWTHIAINHNNISGEIITPFLSNELEGFDINEPEDFLLAEYYLSNKMAKLPDISCIPYQFTK